MNSYVVDKVRAYMARGQKTFKQEAMNAAIARLQKTLEGQFSKEWASRDPAVLKLYPSESGKCARMIQYKALGVPGESILGDVRFKLAMGDLLEMALLYVIAHTPDVNLVDNNKLLDIMIGGRSWRGASDGTIVTGPERRNLEVKSTSGIGFKMTAQRGIDDNFGYLTQASVYVRQKLANKEINVPETVFVYIDRDSMHLMELVVPYDEALARAADEKFTSIIEACGIKKLLPRPYQLGEDGRLGLACSYCSHKYTCWARPNQVVTFDDQGNPVYRTEPTEWVDMIVDKKGKPRWTLSRK